MLWQAGEKLGFGVSVIAPVAEAGEVFSSTAIRLHLAQGDVEGAARALGALAGASRQGRRRAPSAARGIGFPTANMPLSRGTALAHGIYAVRAYFDGEQLTTRAAYLGTRPTFDDGMPVLEVFLFDFDGDLYGREIEVEFIAFIRGDRKFASVEELKAQMAADCAKAREIFVRPASALPPCDLAGAEPERIAAPGQGPRARVGAAAAPRPSLAALLRTYRPACRAAITRGFASPPRDIARSADKRRTNESPEHVQRQKRHHRRRRPRLERDAVSAQDRFPDEGGAARARAASS